MSTRVEQNREINQVWSQPGVPYKGHRIVIDTQTPGPISDDARPFEIVVDDVVVFSIDVSGNVRTGGGLQNVVNVTASTLAVTQATHSGRVITLNRAGGIAVTLPAATGSGAKYTFVVGTTFTSPATIKVTGNDVMIGNALALADGGNTINGWETAVDSDTITFDGSTTGGLKGDRVILTDIAADTWLVEFVGSATGTEATPFSATVT